VMNSLCADMTALNEVFALYGLEVRPRQAVAANDLNIIGLLGHLSGQWAEAMADGRRDHNETLAIAVALRPLIPALQGVVAEADHILGVAS